MSGREFGLNLPFGEIIPSDAGQPFADDLQPVNHIDLSYPVDKNIGSRYILVYELGGKILTFMTFLDKVDHFHLDLAEVNRLYKESKTVRPGFLLITLLENMSRREGFSKVTLYSVQGRIPYYCNLDYVAAGEPVSDSVYGPLTPMRNPFKYKDHV